MQIEVFDWMKEYRLAGNEDFLMPHQVMKKMRLVVDGKPYFGVIGRVSIALARLESYGYLESCVVDIPRGGKKAYRVLYKYVLNSLANRKSYSILKEE
jgi:hypothetical protein